jgi:hypothetical protein
LPFLIIIIVYALYENLIWQFKKYLL